MSRQPHSVYVLDTNVFIGAHNDYYSPNFCPGFWDCLPQYFHSGCLISIDRVFAEITRPGDLVQWVQNAPNGLFAFSGDQLVVTAFARVMTWVQGNTQFKHAAKNDFAGKADGWLVAYAKAHNAVVVTHEKFDSRAKSRVLIPNVCRQFNVPYLNTFEMLRLLGVRFDLRRTQ